MTDREAMKMALDALEWNTAHRDDDNAKRHEAIEALRQALSQPEQKLIGWNDGEPQYVAQTKQWVGLTDDEMNYLWGITPPEYQDRFALARAVEAKLKEKNA